MKRTAISLTPVFVFIMGLIVSGGSQAHDPQAQRYMGQGYGMGHGYGYGMAPHPRYHMGPGMMGPGYGMGHGYGMHRALPRDLTTDDVRHMLGHQLEWQGNPNLKLGKVEEKDEDTIVAEIVTNDGSLVDRFEVDRHTGRMRRSY